MAAAIVAIALRVSAVVPTVVVVMVAMLRCQDRCKRQNADSRNKRSAVVAIGVTVTIAGAFMPLSTAIVRLGNGGGCAQQRQRQCRTHKTFHGFRSFSNRCRCIVERKLGPIDLNPVWAERLSPVHIGIAEL